MYIFFSFYCNSKDPVALRFVCKEKFLFFFKYAFLRFGVIVFVIIGHLGFLVHQAKQIALRR